MRHVTGKVIFAGTMSLLFAQGSAAQELDSQVHIVPELRLQAQQVRAGEAQIVIQPNSNSQNADPQTQTLGPAAKPPITIPPGTRVSMVLSQAISLGHARTGDIINLQTSFPVAADDQMAIPPGTYVRGVIDRVTHKDKNRAVMAMRLRFADIIFANGYTVTIPAPISIDPVLARFTAPDSPQGTPAPVLAGIGGVKAPVAMSATGYPDLPPLPPLHDSGIRTAMIVTGIATTAAIVTAGILMSRRHGYSYDSDIRMEAGTPMETILAAPLVLDASQVAEAIHDYGVQVGAAQATSSPNTAVVP